MKIVLSNIIRWLVFCLLACGIGFFSAENTRANSVETKKKTKSDFLYTIGPMDVLEVHVWKEPDFSRTLLVRPDGQITMPLIGDIQASGLSTVALKSLISIKLKRFIDNPGVTVILIESNSKKFYIIGKINQPGTYPLSYNMTVLQALSVAGGLAEWADKDSIRIIRKSGGKKVILKFDYDRAISGRNLEQNILLKPNDTIIVP